MTMFAIGFCSGTIFASVLLGLAAIWSRRAKQQPQPSVVMFSPGGKGGAGGRGGPGEPGQPGGPWRPIP